MQIVVLGIDLGKNSRSVAGLDESGLVVLRQRLHRASVVKLSASKNRWPFGLIADSVSLGDAGDQQWRDSQAFSTLTSG